MFKKLDEEFICKNCKQKVNKLKYTSRDHCNHCLYSIHIDITPGDRKNDCLGMLKPVNVLMDAKKGKVIVYKCMKCGAVIKNIAANDDDIQLMYQIIEEYSKNGGAI